MIKGTILLTHIKWNLSVDYLDSYSLFIIRVNKKPLVRLTQLPFGDMLIHDIFVCGNFSLSVI